MEMHNINDVMLVDKINCVLVIDGNSLKFALSEI